MVVKIPLYLIPHHRKVAYVYKKWLRRLEGFYENREVYRYEARLARAEFDKIYFERDMRKAKQMLLEKEDELFRFLLPPIEIPTSPGGVDYERYVFFEDSNLDFWHPLEKAVYPEYFTRRELRKQQYLEMWERLHTPPKPIY